MPRSIQIHPLLDSSLIPLPQLISFDNDHNNPPQISLLDIDDYDPLNLNATVEEEGTIPTEIEAEFVYGYSGSSGGIDQEVQAQGQSIQYPSTPTPIILSSSSNEIDNQEELQKLFRLDSYPPSPTLPTQRRNHDNSVHTRSNSPLTSPIKRRQSFLFTSTPNLTSTHNSSSPNKRTLSNRKALIKYLDLDNPPSPILNTPDLTSDSTIDSFPYIDLDDSENNSNTPIILSDPSELIGLFTYHGGSFPFPIESLHNYKGNKENKIVKEKENEEEEEIERLINFEDFNSTHIGLYTQEEKEREKSPNHFVDFQGLLDSPNSKRKASIEEIDIVLESTKEQEEEEFYSPIKDYKFGLDTDEYELDDIEESLVDLDTSFDASWINNMSTYIQNNNTSNGLTNGHTTFTNNLIDHSPSSSSSNSSSGVHNVSPYNSLLSQPSPRKTVPSQISHPSPPDMFQSEIIQSWISTEPTQESKDFVRKLLRYLTKIINKEFGIPGEERFQVDVFGSVSWGGETGNSGDLDLVILDRAQLRGYEPSLWRQSPESGPASRDYSAGRRGDVPQAIANLPRCYHTYDLANCLRRAGMRDVQPVPSASTPIVKFKDSKGKLECDINVNDLGGWYNSSLIYHYCLISPYLLRPMIYILKRWLSAQDLNDASGAKGPATMSSYCLTLMVIAYLQARGCLPNLQRDINVPPTSSASDTTDPDIIWVSWSKAQGVPAHVAFSRFPPEGWRSSEPDLTVSEAVRGFFSFFSQTYPLSTTINEEKARFEHKKQIISILQGGLTSRVMNIGSSRVEDENQRNSLRLQGFNNDQIIGVMDMLRDRRIQDESKMGKGDRGIQPRNWSERRLVVQDPFLWQKNCAGMMSKSGLDRFFTCVDRAHYMLSSRGKSATIEELLFNPSPMTIRSPTPGRGRGYRGTPPNYRGAMNGRNLWSR